ncbi:MAG: hypothetical protein IPP72_21440 [Chitinophagaceae bacterium]|nr:hypothetical protein [Chitinophagaceae bacterium]
MKRLLWMLFCFCCYAGVAQERVPLALKVLDEPGHANGYWFFHVARPANVNFSKKQVFVCKAVYKNNDGDTVTKGSGTIAHILDREIACEINEKDIQPDPLKGDLCYFLVDKNESRKDVFYKLARFAIDFVSVTDTVLFDSKNSLSNWNETNSNELLRLFKTDIHFTGAAMLKQNDSQQQKLKTVLLMVNHCLMQCRKLQRLM